MRAHRRIAILNAIEAAGTATDREVATALDLSRMTVSRERSALVEAGLVEAVAAPEGSHYPIAGWRVVRS